MEVGRSRLRQPGMVRCLGTVQIVNSNVWEKYEIQAQIPDGKQAIYFTYRGYGNLDLLSFTLE